MKKKQQTTPKSSDDFHMRISPALKEKAQQRAAEYGLDSTAAYIKMLIHRDIAKRV